MHVVGREGESRKGRKGREYAQLKIDANGPFAPMIRRFRTFPCERLRDSFLTSQVINPPDARSLTAPTAGGTCLAGGTAPSPPPPGRARSRARGAPAAAPRGAAGAGAARAAGGDAADAALEKEEVVGKYFLFMV